MAEKGASGKSLENRACQAPSAKQPQTAKNQGTPPKQTKKLPTITAITYQRPQPSPTLDHGHHRASPLGKEPVMTVLGYASSSRSPVLTRWDSSQVDRTPANPLQPPTSHVASRLLPAKQTPTVAPLAGRAAGEGGRHRAEQPPARA